MRGPCKILMVVKESAATISKCPLVIYIRYNGLSYQDPYWLNHFEIMTDILIQKWWKYAYLFQNKVDIMLYFKVQGDRYCPQFYIQLVFKAPLCITLTISDQKIMSGSLFLTYNCFLINIFIFVLAICYVTFQCGC